MPSKVHQLMEKIGELNKTKKQQVKVEKGILKTIYYFSISHQYA